MAEHLSVSEIEEEAKKLKRNLEGWRGLILTLNSVLLWEKTSYSGIIIAATSVSFFILSQLNLSILTVLSFVGITYTIFDYLLPTLTPHFSEAESWTSAKERELESICKSLASHKILITKRLKSFFQMKKDHPAYYYTIVLGTLLTLLAIGNQVNDLFFTYVVVTGLLLFPGIQNHRLIDKYTAYIQKLITDRLGGTTVFSEKSE